MQTRGKNLGAAAPLLEIRHQPSGLNSRFHGDGLTFAEYVKRTREMIRKARVVDTQAESHAQDRLNQVVEGNAPFALEPAGSDIAGRDKKYRRGILLTHGLSDSPYFMRHLAVFFQAQGFYVMAVLLPGHGTRPGDLLHSRWQEWERAVAYGADRLAEEVDELYLGGYSAGAVLSILHSLQDQRVRGLFLFAPALEISNRAAYANLHRVASWLLPRLKWLEIKPDRDIYKYESFAKNSATQMHKLTRALLVRMKHLRLAIPIFTVASADDKSVHASTTYAFMAQQPDPRNKLLIYTTDTHMLAQNTAQGKIEWVNSRLPGQKILSSAHTAILLPPEDPHYGEHGAYVNCIHYYPDEMEKYEACKLHPETCWQGEVNTQNLEAGLLRRLMYNPNYAALLNSLQGFIGMLK